MRLFDVYVCVCVRLFDVCVCVCVCVCLSVCSACACISKFACVCVQQQLKFASFRNGRPMSSETTGQDRTGEVGACVCMCVCLWYACMSCTGEVLQHVIIFVHVPVHTSVCQCTCSHISVSILALLYVLAVMFTRGVCLGVFCVYECHCI